MVTSGLGFNSRKSYSAAVTRYLRFNQVYSLDPLGLSELSALRFITYLSSAGLASSTIRVYLSGVRAWLISLGFHPPNIYTVRVKWALKSVERSCPMQARPVSYSMLAHLHVTVDFTYNNFMLLSAMTLAYFGCLRAAEYCYNPSVLPP